MQRKKMRKGTRSCKNCRRRKARCVFRPELLSSCVDCFERGIPCRDQNYNETESTPSDQVAILSERVAQLESLVQSISTDNTALSSNAGRQLSDGSNSGWGAVSASVDNRMLQYRSYATVLGLFDNAIFTTKPGNDLDSRWEASIGTRSFQSSVSKDLQVCRELLGLLPSPADLKQILEATGGWFKTWEHLFGEMQADKHCETLEQFVATSFEQQSPVRVAMGLLCLALSLSSRSEFDHHPHKFNLPLLPMDLSNYYLTLVDRLVISDDEYAGSIEFIELIAMHAKCSVNLCKIQKSWTYFRRAISHAQLLGIHQNQNVGIHQPEVHSQRRKDGWWSLNILDRYTSLLLGLPYATPLDFHEVDVEDIGAGDVPTVLYHRQLAVVAGMISDRNRQPKPSLSTTIKIEQKLDEITSKLPDSWWDVNSPVFIRLFGAEILYKRLMSQHWAAQLQMFLHLPFTFQPGTDPAFEHNKLACFNASRKASRLYHLLRQDPDAAFHMCNIMDFSGFLASLILLLGRLQQGFERSLEDMHVEKDDDSLLVTTSAILLKASTEPNNIVAAQGLQVLNTLKNLTTCSDGSLDRKMSLEEIITIPYFGRIKIAAGKSLQNGRRGPSQEHPAPLAGTEQALLSNEQQDDLFSSYANDVGDFSAVDSNMDFSQIDVDWQQMVNVDDLDQAWGFLTP